MTIPTGDEQKLILCYSSRCNKQKNNHRTMTVRTLFGKDQNLQNRYFFNKNPTYCQLQLFNINSAAVYSHIFKDSESVEPLLESPTTFYRSTGSLSQSNNPKTGLESPKTSHRQPGVSPTTPRVTQDLPQAVWSQSNNPGAGLLSPTTSHRQPGVSQTTPGVIKDLPQ